MSIHDTIRQVLKPLSTLEDGDLAYSLRAGRIDTAWTPFSFDPALAGPRGEAPTPSAPERPHPAIAVPDAPVPAR